jgi:hypothetical protein
MVCAYAPRVSVDPAAVESALAREGVRLVPKAQCWHQRAAHHALRWLTLGGQTHYLDRYVTTIGRSIYVPDGWDRRPAEERAEVLLHELVHVRQFRRYGLVPMAVAYLLLPLPLGLSWCRMRLEREAYEETVRLAFARGGRAATDALRASVIEQFTGGAYGFMWPFPKAVGRWYDALVERLERSDAAAAP